MFTYIVKIIYLEKPEQDLQFGMERVVCTAFVSNSKFSNFHHIYSQKKKWRSSQVQINTSRVVHISLCNVFIYLYVMCPHHFSPKHPLKVCLSTALRQQVLQTAKNRIIDFTFLGPVILVEASERYSYTYRDYTYRSILTLRKGLGEGTVWQARRAPSLLLKHNSETSG